MISDLPWALISVYNWNCLTGKLVKELRAEDGNCIRDVNWHPKLPLIAYTSFGGKVGMFKYSSETEL